jgi:hypothetical protein
MAVHARRVLAILICGGFARRGCWEMTTLALLLSNALSAISASKANTSMSGGMAPGAAPSHAATLRASPAQRMVHLTERVGKHGCRNPSRDRTGNHLP